nr:hypothetical protein OH820_17795 [Streptomyces sp. NBC_00857]
MNWDRITLYVLAGFGVALLALAQLRELLGKISEVVGAWHELRSNMRRTPETQRAVAIPPQTPEE